MGENGSALNTLVWQRAFLSALATLGVVGTACEAAGVSRSTAYARRSSDEAFAEAWHQALENAADRAESEALRRAIDGEQQPALHNGKPIFVWKDSAGKIVPEGTEGATRDALMKTARSDLLLIFLLKALRPEKFRDRYDVRAPSSEDVDASIEKFIRENNELHRQREARAREAEKRAEEAERKQAERSLWRGP